MSSTRSRRRWRLAVTTALATGAVGLTALPAAAHATCSDVGLGIDVHGHHVVRDYVVGGDVGEWPPAGAVGSAIAGEGAALPGGPGPAFHFPNGFAPGASFCNPQSKSPGFHVGG